MKNPANRAYDELAQIVTAVIRFLYGDEYQEGCWRYEPDKDWCGADVCQGIASLLDQHGFVPQVNEEMESTDRSCRSHSFDLRINGPVLRKQHMLLLTIVNDLSRGNRLLICPEEIELVEGLIGLVGAIVDQGVSRYGLDCTIPSPDTDEEA